MKNAPITKSHESAKDQNHCSANSPSFEACIAMMGDLCHLLSNAVFVTTTTARQTQAINAYCSQFERVVCGNTDELEQLIINAGTIIKGLHVNEIEIMTIGGEA